MSHSNPRAAPRRRRAASPGSAPGSAPGSVPGQARPRRPGHEPAEPDGSGPLTVGGALTRTAELSACCLTSFAVAFLLMAVLVGLAFLAYSVLG